MAKSRLVRGAKTRISRRSTPQSFGGRVIETPDEARALGLRMAQESATRLRLRLTVLTSSQESARRLRLRLTV